MDIKDDKASSDELNLGLRLPDDIFDEDEDDEGEEVIFILPKCGFRHLIRDNGTPDSSLSVESDYSEREQSPSCFHGILPCQSKATGKHSNVSPANRYLQHRSRNGAEMEEIQENAATGKENELSESIRKDHSPEKDVDVTETDEACYVESNENQNGISEEDEKGNTPEKDINHDKDFTTEKETVEDLHEKEKVEELKEADVSEVSIKAEVTQETFSKPFREIPIHNNNMGNARTSNSNQDVSSSNIQSKRISSGPRKTVYSFEEIITVLEEKIQVLLKRENYTGVEGRAELKFIRRTTKYSPDVVLNRRIIDKIINFGIAHVFVRVWKSVNTVDFMDYGKQGPAFKNLQTALSIVWNCTDKSPPLCESLIKTHVLHDIMAQLERENVYEADLRVENNLYLVKAYLGILHNIARLCSESRKIFRSAKAVKILEWYLLSSNNLIKTKSYLILSYIISEEENNIINAKDDNIRFMTDILKEALDSENHFSKTYAFWASEIVCGLNHLAVNESNKISLGVCGALPLYVRLLDEGNEEEQVLASGGLWILSFKEDNKRILRHDSKCMDVLQKLTVSGKTENIRRSTRGTLWVLGTAIDDRPQKTSDDLNLPHIMVSYHHKSAQRMMIKVTRRLRQASYKVWMDLDDMHGSTLEAMALAIERSSVVLVCMSQGYKDSPSCRTEAEYTYRQRKDVIPLLLQEGYDPDGWLGAFVGTRLHFDFSSEEKIPSEIQKLIHELGNRGRLPRPHHTSESQAARSFEGSLVHSDSSISLHSYVSARVVNVSTWSNEEVLEWLVRNQLGHVTDRFSQFDGELLLQLKKMQKVAPESFYQILERQFRFDLATSLRLAKILDDVTA